MSRYKTWRGELPRWQQLLKMLQEHDSDQCLPWPYRTNSNGYGTVLYEDFMWRVSRLAFKFAYGRIYRNLFVLHSCDRPACFNPRHLRQGTQAENIADMMQKGRDGHGDGRPGIPRGPNPLFWGENGGNHKLTEAQVLEIRRLYSGGRISQAELARQFSVIQVTISLIIRRKTWKHI